MKSLFVIPLLAFLIALVNLVGCGSSCPAGTVESAGQCVALNGATIGGVGTNQCYDSTSGSSYSSPTGVCNNMTGMAGQCFNPTTQTYYTPVAGQTCPNTGTTTGQCFNQATGTYYTVTPGTPCPTTTTGYGTGYTGVGQGGSYLDQGTGLCTNPTTHATYYPVNGSCPY